MRYKTSRLALQIFDEVLVSDFEHPFRRQNGPPVVHQRFVSLVVATEFAEVIGEWLVFREQQRVAGYAGVDGIPFDMDDPGARQRQMNKAGEHEIGRQFVDDAIFRCPELAHAFDIGLAKLGQVFIRQFGEHVRVRARSALRDIRHCGHKIIELSGSEDARMAGEDLFDQARARARHADDKHRRL